MFNSSNKETPINELQYYIDMDIRGHILGMLWLILIGYRIDKNCIYEHSYGNRIRKNLYNEFSDKPSFSPYLFQPYFQQYESWRDEGLNIAQVCLNKGQDIVIITMDFQRFYYSVDLSEESFERILRDAKIGKDDENYEYIKRLNCFVFQVICKYASLFDQKFQERNFLPIGFLPSNVLSNWCLSNFDKAIVDGWNPLYYGRYVDDILIVDKVEHNSDLYQKAMENNLSKEEIVWFFLQQCSRWTGMTSMGDDVCRANAPLLKSEDTSKIKEGENKEGNNNEIIYRVNPRFNPVENDNSYIKLQNEKLKIFYFKSNDTDALIMCFKTQISKNKSEFRYLPEDEIIDEDYDSIYDLRYEDTINKFRGITQIAIDPYKLSKFLGKKLRTGLLIEDANEAAFARDIHKIFDYQTIIAQHMHWERIIEILLVYKCYDSIKHFVERIIDAIEHIVLTDDNDSAELSNVKLALYLELHSAICKVFSLAYGDDTNIILKFIYSEKNGLILEKIIKTLCNGRKRQYVDIMILRSAYNSTRMSDKSVLPIPVSLLEFNNSSSIQLTNFQDAYKHLNRRLTAKVLLKNAYVYFPYLISMHEIAFILFLLELHQEIPFSNYVEIQNHQIELLDRLNYKLADLGELDSAALSVKKHSQFAHLSENEPTIYQISVGTEKRSKLKIALANAKLNEDDFTKLIVGRPNRSKEKCYAVSHMFNQALRGKADMLVMPESYLPFEWLPMLARACAANQMAVVTGIEHFIVGKEKDGDKNANRKICNFTAVILPYIDHDRKCAYISFHLKRHYAPFETQLIHGYNYREVEGRNYELYKWNGCYFPVYCCYELASISERALFQSYADYLVAVEWNHDTKYFSNIMESLSRDLHCYCIQVNTSDYGDSRITMPAKSETMNCVQTKGGDNSTVLIGEIDIDKLRKFQIKEYELQTKDTTFKPTPPEFDKHKVMDKIQESS